MGLRGFRLRRRSLSVRTRLTHPRPARISSRMSWPATRTNPGAAEWRTRCARQWRSDLAKSRRCREASMYRQCAPITKAQGNSEASRPPIRLRARSARAPTRIRMAMQIREQSPRGRLIRAQMMEIHSPSRRQSGHASSGAGRCRHRPDQEGAEEARSACARRFVGGGPWRGRWRARLPSETLSPRVEKQPKTAFGASPFGLIARMRLSGLSLGAENTASSFRGVNGCETEHHPLDPSAGLRFAAWTAIAGSMSNGASITIISAGAASSWSSDAVRNALTVEDGQPAGSTAIDVCPPVDWRKHLSGGST